MASTLILMRHAKSSHAAPMIGDFDRPLNDRGRRTSPVIGAFLAGLGLAPDIILCSAARRARETLEHLGPIPGRAVDIRYEQDLYLAPHPKIRQIISAAATTAATVMVIGHNPGLQSLALELAKSDARPETRAKRTMMAKKFPTAAVAIFDIKDEFWRGAAADNLLIDYILPKELK